MGQAVIRKMQLDINIRAFRFGLLGPDPFLYTWPDFHRYSSIMHRKRTGAFLMELADRVCDKDTFSYLCGFLCHYALDSLVHPEIISLARKLCPDEKDSQYMHIAIEHRIDLMLGGKTSVPDPPPESIREMFNDSIETVYGWKNAWKKMRRAYWHIRAFYTLVWDRYGILNKTIGRLGRRPGMISYRSGACDGLDLGWFDKIFDQSVEDAVRFITCAKDYISGRADRNEFRRVIGNRPYI